MARSTLVEHPKNPRRITEGARKKLRDKAKEVGLLQPPLVNERSGFMIGGHQRLEILDSLERYKPGVNDYLLDVDFCDLDDKQELEMLVFLNNPSGQGSWDIEKLAEIQIENTEVTFDGMGFDRADMEIMFDGDPRFSELEVTGFSQVTKDSAGTREVKGALAEMHAGARQAARDERAQQSAGEDEDDGDPPSPLEKAKAARAEAAKRMGAAQDTNFYVTVVCKDADEKAKLMKMLNVPKGEQYIAPSEIFAALTGSSQP